MSNSTTQNPEHHSTGDRVQNADSTYQSDKVYSSTGEIETASLGTISRKTGEVFAVKKDKNNVAIYRFENGKQLSKTDVTKIQSDEKITDKFGETIGKYKGREIAPEKEWRTPQNGDIARVVSANGKYLNLGIETKNKLTSAPNKSLTYPENHPLANEPIPASGSFRNGIIIDTETNNFLEKHAAKGFNQETTKITGVAAKTVEAYNYLREQAGQPPLNENEKIQAGVAHAYLDSKANNGWKKLLEAGKNLTKSMAWGAATTTAVTVGGAVLASTLTPAVIVAGVIAGGVTAIGRQIATRKDLGQRQDSKTTQEEKERNGFAVLEHKVTFLGIREPIKQIVSSLAGRDYLEKGGEKQVHKDAGRAKTLSYLVGGVVGVATGGNSILLGVVAGVASKLFTDRLQLRTLNAANQGNALKNSNGAGINNTKSLLSLFSASGKQAALTASGFASLAKSKNNTEEGFASNYMIGSNIKNINDYVNPPPKNKNGNDGNNRGNNR